METRKEYSNGEVTVVWQPAKCMHSGNCVKGLPEVFNLKEKPWINVQNSTTERIIDQVKKCPSGALGFFLNKDEQKIDENN